MNHQASLARGAPIAFFVPLQDFEFEDENGNLVAQYKKGKRYTIREGNTKLYELCIEWQVENKIKIIGG